jgi:Helix-turn-helix domain
VSVKATTWVWQNVRGLTSGERTVALCLADHYNDEKCMAWPSIETIGAECELKRRAVQNALQGLQSKGVFTVRKQAGPGRADRRPNAYVPNFDAFPNRAERPTGRSGVHPVETDEVATGRSDRPNGAQFLTPRGAVECTQTISRTVSEPINTCSTSDDELRERSESESQRERRAALRTAVLTVCGLASMKQTRSGAGALGKAVAELDEVDATPDQVTACGAAYRNQWPDAVLTPSALAKRWAELVAMAEGTPATGPTYGNQAAADFDELVAQVQRHGRSGRARAQWSSERAEALSQRYWTSTCNANDYELKAVRTEYLAAHAAYVEPPATSAPDLRLVSGD